MRSGHSWRVSSGLWAGSHSRKCHEAEKSPEEETLKPWEFRAGRDEVLYDLQAGVGSMGRLANLFRRLKNRMRNRPGYRKWQALLAGKDFDEQLWGVRPPEEAWWHPAVREWARRTLVLAGYEPDTMLLEWEIFWRRKSP